MPWTLRAGGTPASTPPRQFRIAHIQTNAALWNIDFDGVAIFHQCERATLGRFGRHVTDREAGASAREPPVSDQRTRFSEALGFQVAGGIQHLLHAGSALRSFVADHHDVAGQHTIAENAFHCIVLAFEDARRPGEGEARGIHARRLHNAAIHGDIPVEHSQAAVFTECVFHVADGATGAVQIEARVAAALAERLGGADTAGCGAIEIAHGLHGAVLHIPLVDGVS
jgi:hypothetical protein